MPETLNSPRHPPTGDTLEGVKNGGGTPMTGFRHGDESRASMRPNPNAAVTRTGSRVLEEWRRKANRIIARNPAPPQLHHVQQFVQQQHSEASPKSHPAPPYYATSHGSPQVAPYASPPNPMSPTKQPSHHPQQPQQQYPQRQQRRNSLGGDRREQIRAFHHESTSWSSVSYGRLQSPGIPTSPSQLHGHRCPPEPDSNVESIYENVAPRLPGSDAKSTTAPSGGKNTAGEPRVRPALERERRSLRKLTKDSGYETSPYSESDYANMEWLSDQNSEHGLVSPSPTHIRMPSHPAPYWDSLSDHEGPHSHRSNYPPKVSWTRHKTQPNDGSMSGRAMHEVASRCKSAIYPDSCYVAALSKESRRLSTGEGWIVPSEQVREHQRILGRYSSTDSLSSYSSGRHPVPGSVIGAKSTPSLNRQDGRLEELPALAPNGPLAASHSTPNLDKEVEPVDAMVTRKFKKASVYEALANKSGLDFAPTIQSRHGNWEPKDRSGTFSVLHQRSSSASSCQSYHCRQTSTQSTASDCTSSSSSCNGQSFHSRQVSGHSSYSEDEGRVLSPRSEESPPSGHDGLPTFTSNRFRPDRGQIAEDLRRWTRSQPELDRSPPSPGSPPPPAPPTRDASSLRYANSGSDHHEKYPSWPVGQSDGGVSGQPRSHSWTEEPGDGSKDKSASPCHQRPKKYSQTYFTQQLKTVMEKTEKSVAPPDDPRLMVVFQGQYFSHLGAVTSLDESAISRSSAYELDALCALDGPFDREFSFADPKVRSSPERDATPEKRQRRGGANSNGGDFWWSPPPYSTEAVVGSYQSTPMLDRLRLESSRWSREADGGNGSGGRGRDSITSTTSSQETLKWHGSSSDLSVHSDKQPKPSVESVVHSARVQPPQRHNSESVLYYGVDEASAIARSIAGGATTVDVAPPLPRKTRQWSDQVQKNNYINRIQMQVRPVAPSSENHQHHHHVGSGTAGLRAASLAREEIQPPLSPEFAKPLSVAERIQDLERRNVVGRPYAASSLAKVQRKQKAPPGVSPVQQHQGSPATDGNPEKRMAYLDPEKKHKVSDPELKAIQKQAVWSFFERQTGLSAHGRSPTKEGVQFLSRRMAQSLPRDYMQEFKRLQQLQQCEEQKKLSQGGGGPLAATAMTTSIPLQNGLVDKMDVGDAVPACPPRLYRQHNGPSEAKATRRQCGVPIASTVHSPSSSSSSSSSASSPTTPTAPSSLACSPLPRTPSICYNTCTQTDDDLGVPQETPASAIGMCSTNAQFSQNQITRSSHDHSLELKATPSGDFASSQVDTEAPIFSEEQKPFLRSDPQGDDDKERTDRELDAKPAVPSPSSQELRILQEPSVDSISGKGDNVPCEQTPTKSAGKTNAETCLCIGVESGQQMCEPHGSVSDLSEEQHQSPSLSPVADSIEDIELRKIEESAKVLRNLLPTGSSGTYTPRTHRRIFLNSEDRRNSLSPNVGCPNRSSQCSSPDLPLPPPPKNSELEVLTNDEPLPPPPSLNEMSHALAEPQAATGSLLNVNSNDAFLPYFEEQRQSSTSAYDNSCHRSLIVSSRMDKSLSPCSAWEQWHNIRQSNTTLVFHSGEMKTPKTPHIKVNSAGHRASCKEADWNGSPETDQPSSGARRSPTSRLRTTGSVESLRSVGSSNSTASSLSCWQEHEASSPSSSRSGSSLRSKNFDGQPHCRSPMSRDESSCQSPQPQTKEDHVQQTNEAITQTTPSLNKLGRKKREEELEYERLSRDLVNHLSGQDNALRNILVLAPEMKTMADYMEGIFEVDVKESNVVNRRSDSTCSSGRGTGSSPSSPPPALEQTKRMSGDSVQLPSDSAYFTTSESKAKFLTRYSKNMQQTQASALSDLRSGSELSKKKEELVDSITRKLKILRMEQLAIREEIHINDELGLAVSSRVEQLAKTNEVDKFKLHVEEVEKITSLLLGLSGRLARAQNALMTLAEDANPEEKKSLEAKRNKLCDQHEEAKKLKESIDRRGNQVSTFLHKYLSAEEYADYDHFIKMKAKLLMDSREIDDKIKLGEEQMSALQENLKT